MTENKLTKKKNQKRSNQKTVVHTTNGGDTWIVKWNGTMKKIVRASTGSRPILLQVLLQDGPVTNMHHRIMDIE